MEPRKPSAVFSDVITLDVGIMFCLCGHLNVSVSSLRRMTCGGYAASVKRILENQPQVCAASVDLTTETSEAKAVPNWQKEFGKKLAKHLTDCGFNPRGKQFYSASVVVDNFSGRSRGFGFVTFDEKQAMDEAIEPQGSGRDQDGDCSHDRGRERDPNRDYGGGCGGGGGDWRVLVASLGILHGSVLMKGAKEIGAGGRDDRYRRGGGGGGGHYGPDRKGDRSGGCNRDSGTRGGSGNDCYNRDRSGPCERRGTGNFRWVERILLTEQLEVLLLLAGVVKVSSDASLLYCSLGGQICLISLLMCKLWLEDSTV
ncbi:uncharacterized protein LOC130135064 [Syzygium oleosum]|uniref:uncharacterized protein LOC130135064 n=1 Tax=Syzygium oleosum TaxID=219896 RepID=UPI0024BB19F0|nr:uncharacterized protein LOC130135064 [Syzygium oleosum]